MFRFPSTLTSSGKKELTSKKVYNISLPSPSLSPFPLSLSPFPPLSLPSLSPSLLSSYTVLKWEVLSASVCIETSNSLLVPLSLLSPLSSLLSSSISLHVPLFLPLLSLPFLPAPVSLSPLLLSPYLTSSLSPSSSLPVHEETNCHIHFPDSNRSLHSDKSNQVSITGSTNGVELARKRIRVCMYIFFPLL